MEMQVDSQSIRSERERRAWSQLHLASVAELGLRTVQRIEATGRASYESIAAIAAAFSLTVADLTEKTAETSLSTDPRTGRDKQTQPIPQLTIGRGWDSPRRIAIPAAVAGVLAVLAGVFVADWPSLRPRASDAVQLEVLPDDQTRVSRREPQTEALASESVNVDRQEVAALSDSERDRVLEPEDVLVSQDFPEPASQAPEIQVSLSGRDEITEYFSARGLAQVDGDRIAGSVLDGVGECAKQALSNISRVSMSSGAETCMFNVLADFGLSELPVTDLELDVRGLRLGDVN